MQVMLACSTQPDLNTLRYPVWSSLKLDGFRCTVVNGVAMSRQNKPIANRFVQLVLSQLPLHGLDGELMLRAGNFNATQSAFASHSSEPDFVFQVFDDWSEPSKSFEYRHRKARSRVLALNNPRVSIVEHSVVRSAEEVRDLFEQAVGDGFEGLILRDPKAPYKQGRSTLRQGWMLKVKPVQDMEGTIIGFEELMRNTDTSSHKQEHLVPGGMLGAFVLEIQVPGHPGKKQVKVGSGFTQEMREELWRGKEGLLGMTVTFKFQELSEYGIPRFPVFLGFRYDAG